MINLTVAYNPGSLDNGNIYTHVRVLSCYNSPFEGRAIVTCAYGYLDPETAEFVEGKEARQEIMLDRRRPEDNPNEESKLDKLKKVKIKKDDSVFTAFFGAIDELLISEGIFPGAQVPEYVNTEE